MKFEELKLGMTVFVHHGEYVSFYFIDKWTPDEGDDNPQNYYFPELAINKEEGAWYWYDESFISKKDSNESYRHLVSSCRTMDLMPVDEMQKVIKILLGGKTS